jgi:hypothetical protein
MVAKKISPFKILWRQLKFIINYLVKGDKIIIVTINTQIEAIYYVAIIKLKMTMNFYDCYCKFILMVAFLQGHQKKKLW